VKYRQSYRHRANVLKLARDLARSGRHLNHESIIAELEGVQGFADVQRCFRDKFIMSQLDRLCLMARTSGPSSAEALAVFLGEMRATSRSSVGP
jgi:hypothetical protein